ncbi:unnamed protein product [Calypogeia fissa]
MGPVRGGGHRSKGGGTVQREKGSGNWGDALLVGGHSPKGTPGSSAVDAGPRRPERAGNAWRLERGRDERDAKALWQGGARGGSGGLSEETWRVKVDAGGHWQAEKKEWGIGG